ncbi:MAG: hypothetical protein WBY44_04205 [Bryobacteraceae bacterium]
MCTLRHLARQANRQIGEYANFGKRRLKMVSEDTCKSGEAQVHAGGVDRVAAAQHRIRRPRDRQLADPTLSGGEPEQLGDRRVTWIFGSALGAHPDAGTRLHEG